MTVVRFWSTGGFNKKIYSRARKRINTLFSPMSFAAFVRAARQNSGKLGDASPACLESVNFAAYVNSVVKYKV